MKFHKIALAAATLCAASTVSAQNLTINAGGASATRATIVNQVTAQACVNNANRQTRAQGTNVTRITCDISPALAALLPTTFTQLDFNYDNTTGSYLGIGPVAGNGDTIARVNLTTCAVGTTTCSTEATRVRPSIGNADVEPQMFTGVLAPAGSNAFDPSGFAGVTGQFGVGFGIAVSLPLFNALAAEQGVALPSISTSQIVSLATANGGPLNNDWSVLFPLTNPAGEGQPVRFVRRVAGSGTQATFSSQFLNTNCAGERASLPAGAAESSGTYTVLEYGSTGGVLGAVSSTVNFPAAPAGANSANATALAGSAKPANYFAVGIASLENDSAGTGWRFVAVDGNAPTKANIKNGRYNWMAEQVLTLANPSVGTANFGVDATSLDAAPTFFTYLAQITGSPTAIGALPVANQAGIVALPFVADAGDALSSTHATRFRTFGNSCVRPFAVE